MRYSWAGFWLAPLVVPLIGSAVMAPLVSGDGPVILTLAILLIPACVISYGAVVLLFLPALFLLSLLRPVTGWVACALGLALGAATILPRTFRTPDQGHGRPLSPFNVTCQAVADSRLSPSRPPT